MRDLRGWTSGWRANAWLLFAAPHEWTKNDPLTDEVAHLVREQPANGGSEAIYKHAEL